MTTPFGLSRLTRKVSLMALADKINDAPRHQSGSPCSVGSLLEQLDGKEADALHAMLFTLGWSQRKVYEALVAEGHTVGAQTINRHRSRSCRCFQVAR